MADESKELLVRALAELRRLKQENRALRSAGEEPIAIVGQACRFPGGCFDPESYGEFLAAGRSAIEATPGHLAGGMKGGFGSYLGDPDQFDAAFFGISPKEARSLDPQQRLLLELVWHAFEAGNMRADAWAGREVGVFVGMSGIDYALKLFSPANRERIDPYFGTGSTQSPAAGRLAYFFKFNGPAMVVDTACSSSLVAIHLAVQSLRRGECEAAVAAGVNRILGPDLTLNFNQSGLLAPDGICRTFDAKAAGYSRGEGGGALVLKRLADAEAAGDTIFALILGSAVNQDGGSSGLTVPSGPAQQKVIRRALQSAGLEPRDVDYVEAHGTATSLGDPIEWNALGEVFSRDRPAERPLLVGSVKTNLGHLEAAAGMASSFKVIQALRRGSIPPHLNFTEPNPHMDWANTALRVANVAHAWSPGARRRVAGVSGFGFVGTNAHIVFAEAPPGKIPTAFPRPPQPELFVLSARTPEALRAQAKAAAVRLVRMDVTDWPEAVRVAASGRVPFAERLSVAAADPAEAAALLERFAVSGRARGASAGRAGDQVRTAFVFTGQGSQYAGMGRRLYAAHPVFREVVDRCSLLLRDALGRDLREVMFAEAPAAVPVPVPGAVFEGARNAAPWSELDETTFSQAGLFVIEYALARVWEGLGVRPELVLGHSVGEYAAACIAGVFSLEDGLRLIVARGRLMEQRSAPGAMLTVFADESVVAGVLAPYARTVSIAAVNGPEIVLVSGATETIGTVERLFADTQVRTVRMRISHAFHSPLTEPVLAEFENVARTVAFSPPSLRLISNVTGGLVGAEIADPLYWSRHLRQSVRFCESMTLLHSLKLDRLVEIGPEPTLIGLDLAFRAARSDLASAAAWIPSLRRGHDDLRSILDGAGQMWTAGTELEWSAILPPRARQSLTLPGYAFQRKRHWFDFAEPGLPAAAEPLPSDLSPAMPSVAPDAVQPDPEAILAEVQTIFFEVSGLEPADLPRSANLLEMGLDSLMFVRSGRMIERRFDVKISIKQFYEELHCIGPLVDFLVANARAAVPAAAGAPDSLPVLAVPGPAPEVPVRAASASEMEAPQSDRGLDPVIAAHFRMMERYLGLQAAPVPAAPPAKSSAVTVPVRATNVQTAAGGVLTANFGGLNLEEEKNLSAQQRDFLGALVGRYVARTRRSKEQTQAWRRDLADWKGSLQFKLSLKELKYPIISDRAQGSRIWDIDGNEYIDLALGMGVHFLGHSPRFVTDALHRQIDRTAALGPQSDLAGEVAAKICRLTGAERVSLAITGSGAVMLAQRLARAATGRPCIAQFAGAYHGIGSEVLVVGGEDGPRPLSPGIPPSVVQNAQVLDYGSEEALEWIREHAALLAAVIVEPVQSRRPGFQPHRFLRRLRRLTAELGIALIFDEMINGFRIQGGGAQQWFGIEADLVTYGKIVGGGMPLAVVAGKAKFLDWIDGGFWQFGDGSTPNGRTIFTGGTHNRHPLALAAANATLDHLIAEGASLYEAANRRTERLGKELNAFFESESVSIRMAWFGSQFRFESLGEAFDLEVLFYLLTELGFYTWEQRICCLSTVHTDEEIDRLVAAVRTAVAAMRAGGFALQAGPRAPRRVLPMSPVQRRLYALCQREGAEMPYHLSGVWELTGCVDPFRLQDAFQEIVRRHESLRTAFGMIGGVPSQYVFEEPRFFLEEIKPAGKTADSLLRDFIRPFDLERPPLLRVGYAPLEGERALLFIDVHHIAADGLSMNVILTEFAQLYDGQHLAPVKRQYRHACAEADELKLRPAYRAEEAYWLKEMVLPLPVLELPGDWPRSGSMDFRGDKLGFRVDAPRTRRLEALARENGASLYMVLLSGYVALLHRLGGAEDLIVGLPVAGRPGSENDAVVGMFVNSLPLRFLPRADQAFVSLLQEVRSKCLGAYDHTGYEFADLVERLDLPRNPDRNPVFDTMFAYESADGRAMRTRDLAIRTIDQFEGSGMLDLSVDIIRENGVLGIRFHYATRLFRAETIARFAAAFDRLLDAVLATPQAPVGRLPILPAEELRQVAVTFCRTAGPISAPTTLVALWAAAVAAHGERNALVCSARRMTYRETETLANRVAVRLAAEFKVGSGDRVALLVNACSHTIAAILGILKAGAAYVPIDPETPRERVRGIVTDAKALVLIADEQPDWALPELRMVTLADLCRPGEGSAVLPVPPSPESLAYVIYTSGSTGQPKGVMIEHRSAANSILWRIGAYPFAPGDSTLLMPTYAFDASILDIFPTLFSGGRLVLRTAAEKRDLAAQAAILAQEQVKSLLLTPSLHSLYLDELGSSLAGLKWVCVAGEATSNALVRKHFARLPGVRLFNEYGPTENSVVTTFTELHPDDAIVTIGRPIAGCEVYVVQANGEFCGIGVPGELVAGGVGLARGYLGKPELTEAAFVPAPWDPAKRIYRTGDLARWRADGTLEFLGRRDAQIKLRGYRIELGEIEDVIGRQPGVAAVAVKVAAISGEPQLVAYVATASGFDERALRLACREILPTYMVPALFVRLEALPLTPSGKVDRRALPVVELAAVVPSGGTPRGEREEALAKIWGEVLRRPSPGRDDDYFRLGGDSIKGIQIISRLLQVGWKLEMSWLFRSPTIAGLAERLQPARSRPAVETGAGTGEVPLGPIQHWFLESCAVQPDHFNQAVWLESHGRWNVQAMQAAWSHVVKAHDAFRLRLEREGNAWRQRCAPAEVAVSCRIADWRGADRIDERLVELQQSEQSALSLSRGPVTRAVVVRLDQQDRLFWTAHHLAVDGISWRILIEDLGTAYSAYCAGTVPPPPLRTASFGTWTRTVGQAVAGGLLRDEIAYWQQMAGRPEPTLPRGRGRATGTVADLRRVELVLPEDLTQRLLQDSHATFRTRGAELLVAALRVAYAEWNPWQPLELLLEGHGREPALADLDVSRTVGWFTSVYPAYFPPARVGAPDAALIRETKECLRAVPRNGAGFGWLQATGTDAYRPEWLRAAIGFNFLGDFEDGDGEVRLSAERPIAERGINQALDQSIAFVGYVAGRRMHWSIEYDSVRWPEITMEGLLARFAEVLREVDAFIASTRGSIASPADFVFNRLKLEAYDRMVERHEWEPDSIEDIYPLSPLQRGLYFEATKVPASEAYFEQMAFRLDGPVDRAALEASWRDLVARHRALRSVFVHPEGADEPLQVVFGRAAAAISFVSIEEQSPEQQRKTVGAFLEADRAVPFALEFGPLMRVRIFQLGRESLQLVWSHHHILMDGWCVGILYEDLMRSYEARAKGRSPAWELPADYRGYLRWLDAVDRKASGDFWRRELAGHERMVSLPRVHAQGGPGFRCVKAKQLLAGGAWEKLSALAAREGATTATLLNTLWGILLARCNDTDDVVFGGIVSGRPESLPEVERMVGLFVNAVPVRLRFAEDMTLAAALRCFQAGAIERRPHEFLALSEMAEHGGGMRELFDHLVVLENYPMDGELRGEGAGDRGSERPKLSQVEGFERTHFDFTLVAVPRSGGLELEMTFNANVYDETQIARVQGQLVRLVESFASRPEVPCLEAEFLPAEESGLIKAWNETSAPYPAAATIHGLFAEQVRLHASRPAVTAGTATIDYRQADAAARRLAALLLSAGIVAGDRVAIWLPRGIDMITSLLGTVMAGGCYVPLDPEYPEERLKFILQDSGAKVVVAHSAHRSPFPGVPEICLDTAEPAAAPLLPAVDPDQAAYIIYTSGSTGRPKGCLISHRNVVRLLRNDRFGFDFGPEDVWVVAHSFCFDFSVWEMYGALTFGGRVVVAPRDMVRDVGSFVALVRSERVTVLNQTPAAFYAFAAEALRCTTHDFAAHLRYVIFGGDRLEPHYLSDWADRYGADRPELVNMYGITETTVHVTIHRVTEDEIRRSDGRSIIGQPLPETQVWVLDSRRRMLPIGVAGEMYVGGTGVGSGYLNRAELTAERFLPDPAKPGFRLYRTGDLGRWREDGRLEYLGRNDHQVQVRGFRVELGEVEAACLALGGIDKAVVLPFEEAAGQVGLVAYLVGETRSLPDLRSALLGRLPQYMIPGHFEWLAEIPLTANGKVDRKALPRPGIAAANRSEGVAPRNRTERILLDLWREVLGLDNIGVHDNFFELGGQSLKAVRLRAKIESSLRISISLKDLFARPTVAELAASIEGLVGQPADESGGDDLSELMADLAPEELEAQLRKLQP